MAGHCGGLAAPGSAEPGLGPRLPRRHCVYGTSESCASLLGSLSANLDHGLLRLALNAPAACDPPQCRPRSIVDPTATLRTRPWLPWGSVRPRRRGWRHSRRGSHSRHRLRGSQSSDEFIKGWIEVRTREDVPGRCEVQPIRNQATTQRIQENTKQSFPITHTVLYCLRRTGSIGEPWISRWAGDGAGPGAGVGRMRRDFERGPRPGCAPSRKIVARSCAQLSRVRSHTIPSLRIPVATHEAVPAQRAHTSVRPRGPQLPSLREPTAMTRGPICRVGRRPLRFLRPSRCRGTRVLRGTPHPRGPRPHRVRRSGCPRCRV